jgi:exosortase A
MDEANRAPVDSTPAKALRAGISLQLLIVLGALALTALLYWPTSLEIVERWQDTVWRRYTHGWIVFIAAIVLIWRDRTDLALVPPRPALAGWFVVLAASAAWLVGYNSGVLALSTFSMPILVLAAIWVAGGFGLARRASFPVLYLYFAMPLWEFLNPLLQWLTAVVNLWLTRLVGIPVVMDGNIIHIPEGWFEIAGGCSGLHFFIVALAIAALHGHIDRDDARSRAMLLALAGGLALVTNWIRVFIIIVAGHLTDMQHFLVKVDHYYFGWVLFSFVLVGYVFLASYLPRRSRAQRETPLPKTAASGGRAGLAVAFTMAALAAGPVWAWVQPQAAAGTAPPPTDVAGFGSPKPSLGDWRPVFANADEEMLVEYYGDGATTVAVYRAVYHSQRQGKELRGHGNSVIGAGYRELEATTREVPTAAGSLTVLERVVESDDGRRRLVWSLFAVDGEPTAMRLTDQVAYGARSLFGPPPASVVALSAECQPDCDHARTALDAFARPALPALLAVNE